MSENPRQPTRVRRKRSRLTKAANTNYFVHLIFYERRFRRALLAMLVAAMTLAIMLPKIWITSPPHIEEVVRVSGLDLMQTWNLKRRAKDLDASGASDEAISTWIAATANNPCDTGALRGLLGALADAPTPPRNMIGMASGQSRFLLRLTRTNAQDVALSARCLLAYELLPEVVWVVKSATGTPQPAATECLLVALFLTGRMDEFAGVWDANRAGVSGLPLANLYHAAWQAGWGPAAEAATGRTKLETEAAGGTNRATALRLLMIFHASRLDLASYEAALSRAEDLGITRVSDQIRHWILLDQSGRRERSVALASQHTTPATTPEEAGLLIQAWRRLGMTAVAVDFASKSLVTYPYHPALWTALAELLTEDLRWDALKSLAVELRRSPLAQGYTGWSYHLEAMADHHQNRTMNARAGFMEAATNGFSDTVLAFSCANTMRKLGYPEAASTLLQGLEERYTDSAKFWQSLQIAAYEARRSDVILEASERLVRLRPESAVAANNYAAALLTTNIRPEEALRVTTELYGRLSSSTSVRINHATALLRNGRLDTADEVLRTIDAAKLNDSERNSVNLAHFELLDARGATNAALEAAGRVERRYLFATQQERFAARVAALRGGR